MCDADIEYFPVRKSIKLSSQSYADNYMYTCGKSYLQLTNSYRAIRSQQGDPGESAEFHVIQAQDGLCRLQVAGTPNMFLYQQYNGNPGAFYYGYEIKDEALFRITRQEDGTVTLLNMKPNAQKYLYMGWNGISFTSKLDESGKWVIHLVNVTEAKGQSENPSQPKFRPSQPKRPLPRDQRFKTSQDNQYDVLQYEEPRKVIANVEEFGPTAFPHVQSVIQGCIYSSIAPSGIKPKVVISSGEVTLISQADILEGDHYANMHIKLADHTVGNAIVQIGPCFGMRLIQRALCESVLLQCVVRLSRTKDPLPIIITAT